MLSWNLVSVALEVSYGVCKLRCGLIVRKQCLVGQRRAATALYLDHGTGIYLAGQAHTMSDSSPPARPIFDPVDTSFDPNDVTARDDVESPSLSSSNALARFEFEPGRSKDGTKVLMVEWEEDASTKSVQGDWELSWEGKRTVLPAREQSTDENEELPVNRLYFLLGAGVSIPTTVRLQKGSIVWRTNPLPAIFSPELGATARQAGKKGVLHTIWAKKRLQVLQREIENESKDNAEGIGLEMAVAEKEWIEHNFGVAAKSSSTSAPAQGAMASVNSLNSPSSPRSPGGGRLMDKLKGLKLGTQDLSSPNRKDGAEPQPSNFHNPLSPETSDVAVGSFGSFAAIKGMANPSTLAAKPAQTPSSQSPRRIAAQRPPDAQQQSAGMASLNAFASGDNRSFSNEPDGEDDLFALPMSPRSPETTKSPFSFGSQDTMRYMKGEKA